MKKIFFIEPYVYTQIEENNFVLYNTLTGKFLFKKNEEELLFIKKNFQKQHILLEDEINNKTSNFIKYLQRKFFAQTRESVNLEHYQHSPSVVTAFEESDYHKKSLSDFISDLTFYINGECFQSCELCKSAYKQFSFCTKLDKTELKFIEIEDVLSSFSPKYLQNINILGGNILYHSEFDNIVNFLNKYSSKKNYYINYKNLSVDNISKLLLIDVKSTVVILFSTIPSVSEFSEINSSLSQISIPLKWVFVIQNTNDIKTLENLKLGGGDYEVYPYINPANQNFIRKNVFLTKKDILSVPKLSYKQILEKNNFNLLLWGKTYILNNKDFYANLNSEKLGKVFSENVSNIIFEIVNEQKDVWHLTRKQVDPCNKCVYRIFCPPISNYELFSNRYNFCNMK